MRRSRAARVGAVGTRRRGTASAARSLSTSRSVASSRLRSWLRSSCATALSTGPARAITRRFCTSDSDSDASTSNSASTRVDDFCACWPPGPLERETRSSISEMGTETERVTRIDSRSMACILLDIDGVLHVSGDPIPGAQKAVAELRGSGHLLRFVTNNSTRPRTRLAQELREMGFELEDAELQTTSGAAARELEGKRVLALVMAAIVPDLEGLELVGDHADAVLVGGCDETLEPNQVFSYMNLARAFAEIQMGASFYCLHKNRWWQTSRGPMLDGGAFVAGLEYATGVEATVLGKPSPSYFAAALDALDAEPELTWLVTDDVEGDIRGARLFGIRTALVRTGKFRPETLETAESSPDIVASSLAQFPALLEEDLRGGLRP
jgi:HAD superfamily hydrolase (TIGR01458 family)